MLEELQPPHQEGFGVEEMAQPLDQGVAADQGVGVEAVRTSPLLDVVVERRRFGNTELVGVLSTHTSEHVPTIAAALADCDVVGIEQVGVQDEQTMQAKGAAYSKLLSTSVDPAQVDAVFTALSAQLAEGGDDQFVVELLSQLKGTDKQVVLLDISGDHPDYPQVQQARESTSDFVGSIAELFPVAQSRELLATSLVQTAESYRIRDRVIASQIDQLSADTDRQADGKRAGVMVGLMHYRAIMETGIPADPSATDKHVSEIAQVMGLLNEGVEAIRESGSVAPELVDRILLAHYLVFAMGVSGSNRKEAESIVRGLDPAQVSRLLSATDSYIQRSDDPKVKARDTRLFLNSIIDISRRLN